ncbi:MAG: ATP-binding protein [Bdellovibrionota bacterium]
MSSDATTSAFRQTRSISRRFRWTILLIGVFFILEFVGLYLSSWSALRSLARLHEITTTADISRQAREVIYSINETLAASTTQSGSALESSRNVLIAASKRELDLIRQAREIVNVEEEIEVTLSEAESVVVQMEAAFTRFGLNPAETEQARLLGNQFALEALEHLRKTQIQLTARADVVFKAVNENRNRPIIAGAAIALVLLSIALWFGLNASRRLSSSLTSLVRATKEITAGNMAYRAEIVEPDEIGYLANAFNLMTESLENRTVSRDAFERRSQELAAANRELEAFSYSVSHDLRAPLRAIDGFSHALLEENGDRLDEQGRKDLTRVRMASQTMGKLIDDLLNLSRLSRAEMKKEDVDLTEIASAIAKSLKESDPTRDVEFAIQADLHAEADPALIRIALDNLIGNAWKYTSKHPRARIEVGRAKSDGKTVFFVRDDGAGFDPAFATRLFGAFQRLHSAKEFPGTGIGLATVARIIRRHGGTIWAEGQVEKGSTFSFTL